MNNENRKAVSSYLVSTLCGAGISLLTALALILISSAVLLLTKDPLKHILAAALFCLTASSFSGGFAGAKKGSSALCGILSGVFFAALLFAASLFIKETEAEGILGGGLYSLISKSAAVLAGALGAFSASRTPSRKRSFKAAPRAPKIKKI